MTTPPDPLLTTTPARVVVVGDPDERLAQEPSVPHRLDYVDDLDPAGVCPRDVVVVRWHPSAQADDTLDELTALPASERPRLVVAGDIMEDALRGLIDRHGVVNVVGTRGPANAIDLAVTVDKLLSNDLFGMGRYFQGDAQVSQHVCREAAAREQAFAWARGFAEGRGVNRRIVDLLMVVIDEMLTNALYNAPTDERGRRPNANLPRTVNVEVDGGLPVELELRCDGRRIGISTSDPFGSLEPEVVVASLRRCFERPVPRGETGGAGLGLYLLFGALSHVVFNVARGRRTEVIGLIDITRGLRHLKTSPKSFNLFMER